MFIFFILILLFLIILTQIFAPTDCIVSEWSECSNNQKTRTIIPATNGGNCAVVDTISNCSNCTISDWTVCDGNNRKRTRKITQPINGDTDCTPEENALEAIQTCNNCIIDWTKCINRTRTLERTQAINGGTDCTSEQNTLPLIQTCNHCTISDWTACDLNNRIRTRIISQSFNGGTDCTPAENALEVTQTCNNCIISDWTPCDVNDGFNQRRIRTRTQAINGGTDCTSEQNTLPLTQICNNCIIDWTPCNGTNRVLRRTQAINGTACTSEQNALPVIQTCNHCTISDWIEICNGTNFTRSKTIKEAINGGRACTQKDKENALETQICLDTIKIYNYSYAPNSDQTVYNFIVSGNRALETEVLIVGGGGGGGRQGSGGGGGDVFLGNITIPIGSHEIRVGRGGDHGNNDYSFLRGSNGNSSGLYLEPGTQYITQYISNGGGGGGAGDIGSNVGSDVGKPGYLHSPNLYTIGGGGGGTQGGSGLVNNIFNGYDSCGNEVYIKQLSGSGGNILNNVGSAGGGGATGNGGNSYLDSNNLIINGDGGTGVISNITGLDVGYGGGGGGGASSSPLSQPGAGVHGGGTGGGNSRGSSSSVAGKDGTGGGGGGGGHPYDTNRGRGAKGGDGIVIIRHRR